MNTGGPDPDPSEMTEEDENESLIQFLESEIFSEEPADEDNLLEPPAKRPRLVDKADNRSENVLSSGAGSSSVSKDLKLRIETGIMSNLPPELFPHILKFLSSEDLMACSKSCRFLSFAASDESLWRRLYCIRWGLFAQPNKMRQSAWKKLYIQRDEEDMVELVRTCQPEFKEYYIQMQAAKRTQAPLLSQWSLKNEAQHLLVWINCCKEEQILKVNDDRVILDKTVADQVNLWRSSRGFTDKLVPNHACSGVTCSYHMIGDVYVCEKTGLVHVCDDTCREVVMDPSNELLVCTISGHCFDRLLSPGEMEEGDTEQQQIGGATDDPEPFMGSGRFARAYLLGYNCEDEKELDAVLRFC